MKRWMTVGLASVSFSLAALAGCGGSVATEAASVTADGVATKAPVAVATHGHVKLAAEALSDVPLRDDQRVQIEKLAADAEGRQAAISSARQELRLALADQVAAGAIDRAALQPKIDAVGAAALSAQGADRAALEQLHAILDPGQRSAFVDALVSRFHGAGHGHMHKGGEWRERWADLKLTDAQTSQIDAILHDSFAAHHGDWKAGFDRGQKTLDAFKGESFVMDQVAPPVDAKAKTVEMTGRFVGLAERVLPILTAEQRTAAAAKLHAQAAATGDDKAGDPLF